MLTKEKEPLSDLIGSLNIERHTVIGCVEEGRRPRKYLANSCKNKTFLNKTFLKVKNKLDI